MATPAPTAVLKSRFAVNKSLCFVVLKLLKYAAVPIKKTPFPPVSMGMGYIPAKVNAFPVTNDAEPTPSATLRKFSFRKSLGWGRDGWDD